MDRRSLLKTVGGIGAASAVGAGGIATLSGSAAASSGSLSISNSTTSELNDGELSYVGVDIGGDLKWNGFDEPVNALEFISQVRLPNQGTGWKTLNQVKSDPFADWSGNGDSNGWGGGGEYVDYTRDDAREGRVVTDAKWVIISDGTNDPSGYRTAGLNIPDLTSYFDAPDDDGDGSNNTNTTTVEFRSTTYFLNQNDNRINNLPASVQPVQGTARFKVTTVNEAAGTSGSSSGSSTAG